MDVVDYAGLKEEPFESDTSISTAKVLPGSPKKGWLGVIQADGGDLRYRSDGTDPVNAVAGGILLKDGNSFLYTGTDITKVKVIGPGAVNVQYYSTDA